MSRRTFVLQLRNTRTGLLPDLASAPSLIEDKVCGRQGGQKNSRKLNIVLSNAIEERDNDTILKLRIFFKHKHLNNVAR
jgi:hypothetical protein